MAAAAPANMRGANITEMATSNGVSARRIGGSFLLNGAERRSGRPYWPTKERQALAGGGPSMHASITSRTLLRLAATYRARSKVRYLPSLYLVLTALNCG